MKNIALLFALVGIGQANASECTPLTPEAIAKGAEIAFVGRVKTVGDSSYKPNRYCWERSERNSRCGGKLVTLEVSERLRGNIPNTVTVVAEDACYCLGPYWDRESRYLVVARMDNKQMPGQLVAENQCGGTIAIEDGAEPIITEFRR
jgi:hypothetical protein